MYYAIRTSNKEDEAVYKTQYEVARWLAKHIWNQAGKKLKRPIKQAKDVEEFAWDRENVKPAKPQTLDEMKSEIISIAKYFSKKKK